ncbi:DUF3368 domain-containing protein [Fibrobacter sp. UWH1]|uniref:DUF3368 domain-containing protein n=1 Tax=Fibrobacter sp. UWH1 TaxID=1964354 RepID=UPI000B525F54|nr:DUF3368 domain-containing protein [Fibrobacter sp. UWH1]OWV13099.1 DNA-binding protein [Fibrobacter sp. UWH1]
MIVVSDTTPLISLLKIRRLDLLKSLFGAVRIPQGVFEELTANPDFSEEAEEIRKCEFIEIQDVNPQEVSLFRRATGLDLGESEALVLTDRLNADLLLVDEIRARHVAKTIGLNIMGTIGIFRAAYKDGYISADEVREAVEILRSSGRHIGERLFKKLLESL